MPASSGAVAARSRRVKRLRTTAPPTALDTTKPTRGERTPVGSVEASDTTSSRPPARVPRGPRPAARNCAASRSRCRAASTPQPQADSSARPLRRRPARMARPARVAIRARKPCVLARRRLLGWKVRLLTVSSPSDRPGARGERPGKGGRCSRYAGRNRRPAQSTGMRKRPEEGSVKGTVHPCQGQTSRRHGRVDEAGHPGRRRADAR